MTEHFSDLRHLRWLGRCHGHRDRCPHAYKTPSLEADQDNVDYIQWSISNQEMETMTKQQHKIRSYMVLNGPTTASATTARKASLTEVPEVLKVLRNITKDRLWYFLQAHVAANVKRNWRADKGKASPLQPSETWLYLSVNQLIITLHVVDGMLGTAMALWLSDLPS